jgi:hypothetical protein
VTVAFGSVVDLELPLVQQLSMWQVAAEHQPLHETYTAAALAYSAVMFRTA